MQNEHKKTDASRREFLGTIAAAGGLAILGATRSQAAPASAAGNPPRSIHPYPNKISWGDGLLNIKGTANLTVGHDAQPAIVEMMKDMWRRFTFGAVELSVGRDAGFKASDFSLAGGRPPHQEPTDNYALRVDNAGIGASAADAQGMRHAWFTLLQLLDADDAPGGGLEFAVPHVEIHDWPAIKFRGLHLCIFHETPPHMIERAIRLAAFLKFTHVVLEFWGMLRLEALKEISWPEAWSKEDAGKLVAIARDMGMEVIPMFNSWGHATASRIKHGRHVVLDQNPRLAPLFEPDGWTWCLTNERSQALIRSICDELIEFSGPGHYFHIGCDEAYSHATCDRCRKTDRVKLFADHVNNLAAHIEKRGRRAIMWGDPLLERAKWPSGFSANGSPALPTHLALDQISRKILIADWHYNVSSGDIPTLAHFRGKGFQVLACPWNSLGNIRALARAAVANEGGFLMTTWHHLAVSIPTLVHVAGSIWSPDQTALGLWQSEGSLARAATASMLRKLVPAEGKFDRAGWNPFELPAESD